MFGTDRQRDLLPLRLPAAEGGIHSGDLSRGTRQRILRRLAADAWVREGVQTLNSLYGRSGAGIFAPLGSQASALAGLADKYRQAGPPPQSRPEEALQALLGSMSVYSLDNIECNVASYDEALVSWPEPGSHPVRIAEHLAPEVGNLLSLAGASELLADSEVLSSCEPVRPYIDPVLAHSSVHMGRFLGRLFKSRMLQFVPGKHDHTVGVFFVRKKSGKLRLILDTRRANHYFVKPRSSQLPTPSAWCSIEVDQGDTLYTAAGDVADAFHRMELPAHLRRFFRLPALKCRFLDKCMWPTGCGPEDYVTPEYATLPMGWNWSLYFCQSLLEAAAAQVDLSEADRVEDRTWTGRVAGDRVVHAQYVDNFFISGTDSHVVQSAFERMRQVLEAWGFSIHEVTEAQPVVHGLGLIIDGTCRRISLSPARIWKLRLAALALGRRRVPPPAKVIEKVVGHFTFAMMIRRECLSIFNAVYKYVRAEKACGSLWRAAQQEILQASSILPLMCTSLDLPWSSTVMATDASEVGYGVCERQLDSDRVALIGRTCEQWRYSVEGAIKARTHALGQDAAPLDEGRHYDRARVRDTDFNEVGVDVLDSSSWHVVFSGEWQHHENILRTEGRAMLSGVRHLLRCRRHAGYHHLLLVDNLALALACTKGRGSSSLANRTCQQLCALALASDSKFHVRWIPSERNCADRPSREPWLKKASHPPSLQVKQQNGLGNTDFAAAGCPSHSSDRQQEAVQVGDQCPRHRAHPCRRPFASGSEQGQEDLNSGSLQQCGGRLPVLVSGPLQPDDRLRLPPHCVPQRALCPGRRCVRRGVRFRRLSLPVPRVREAWIQETGSKATATWLLRKCGCLHLAWPLPPLWALCWRAAKPRWRWRCSFSGTCCYAPAS